MGKTNGFCHSDLPCLFSHTFGYFYLFIFFFFIKLWYIPYAFERLRIKYAIIPKKSNPLSNGQFYWMSAQIMRYQSNLLYTRPTHKIRCSQSKRLLLMPKWINPVSFRALLFFIFFSFCKNLNFLARVAKK